MVDEELQLREIQKGLRTTQNKFHNLLAMNYSASVKFFAVSISQRIYSFRDLLTKWLINKFLLKMGLKEVSASVLHKMWSDICWDQFNLEFNQQKEWKST